MPDHLHVIIEGKSDESDVWRSAVVFKQRSGVWLSRNKSVGQWQKDFYDHIFRQNESMRDHVFYIVNNPVRKGLVAAWQAYPFSGCIGYDSLDEVLSLL